MQKDEKSSEMDLSNLREDYEQSSLRKKDLHKNPIEQFNLWFTEILKKDLIEPNAMVLSTSYMNKPTSRTVLLKSFNDKGFVFFTNYSSRKGKEILSNSNVSLLFPWYKVERQVIILGDARKISRQESFEYFTSRPIASQIGALVSNQSQVINSRKILESKLEEIKNKYNEKEIPLPNNWGGYRVYPNEIEFWQGRTNRLHDRFIYKRNKSKKIFEWEIERLSP